MSYAILLLLGPGQIEINRLSDLLSSIVCYEDLSNVHFVAVNDGSTLLEQLDVYRKYFKSFNFVDNPLYGKCNVLFDRHAAGMIDGVRFIKDQLDVEFIVKMDTDVLCINPFSKKIQEYFLRSPDVGIAGTFLNWPMGGSRQAAFEDWRGRVKNVHHKPWIKNFLLFLRKGRSGSFLSHFKRRSIFKDALQNGYQYGQHIMGGGYAMSRLMVGEWSARGYLKDCSLFERSYLGEDSVMTIMAYASGFKPGCFNNPGDVFGVWYREPECAAEVLQSNGYALIHSIKSANPDDELKLRNSFKKVIDLPLA
jgi:hypothetical protein